MNAPPRTTRLSSILLALCLGLAACGDSSLPADADPCAGKSREAGTREVRIESQGRERRFTLYVPESALTGEPAPLVLGFHGVLSSPRAFLATTGFEDEAQKQGFVLAAGAGVERSWNSGVCCDPAMSLEVDDVSFVRDMVAKIEAEVCIDPERVFATGFSNGGAMSFLLACDAADLFAAAAPVGGALASSCDPSRPIPTLIINNVDDPIVPFVLGEVSFEQLLEVNSCEPELITTSPAANTVCEQGLACEADATTEFCAVSGISHVWPGGSLDPAGPFRATDAVWDFFREADPNAS